MQNNDIKRTLALLEGLMMGLEVDITLPKAGTYTFALHPETHTLVNIAFDQNGNKTTVAVLNDTITGLMDLASCMTDYEYDLLCANVGLNRLKGER